MTKAEDIQSRNTQDYKEAHNLSIKGLPDLDGIQDADQNEVTKDYLKALRMNKGSRNLSQTSVEADEDIE